MSKVLDAWDRADFESVGAQKLSRFNRKDIRRAIRESRYANKLINLAEETYVAPTRRVSPADQIKVVTILHGCLPHQTGGYSGRAQGLLKGLQENGLQVRAYTRPGYYNERVDKKAAFPFPIDVVDGVEYRHLPADVPRKIGEFEYMYNCIDWYREIFQIERPNVVHVRSTFLIALPALIAAHSLHIPVVYEVSGLWELVFEGRGEIGRAKRITRFEDLVCKHADRIVSMNTSMAALLDARSEDGLSIGQVPNAVDTSRFSETPRLEAVDEFAYDVGYVGSMVDYEGLDLLIEAVALAREEGTNLRVKLVGKGVEAEKLEQLASERGVSDLVNFVGPVSASLATKQFDDVNVVVLPRKKTPATDNVTPLKPFEAMAAGRPLLVSSVSALKELSRDGELAEVFEAGDAADLLEKLKNFLDDVPRQLRLAAAAREVVETEHNWNYVAHKMFEELVDNAVPHNALPYLTYGGQSERFGQMSFGSVDV